MLYLLITYNTSMYVLSCFQMLERVCALRWCLLFDALINTDTKSHGVLVPMCCLPQRAGTQVLCCMKDRSQLQCFRWEDPVVVHSLLAALQHCLIFTWGWTPTMVITLLIQTTRQSVPQDFIVWEMGAHRRHDLSQVRLKREASRTENSSWLLLQCSVYYLNPPRHLLQGGFLLGWAT